MSVLRLGGFGFLTLFLASCSTDPDDDWLTLATEEAYYARGVCATETTPNITTPQDAAICEDQIAANVVQAITWDAVPGADGYQVQFSLSSDRPEVNGQPSQIEGFSTVAFTELVNGTSLSAATLREALIEQNRLTNGSYGTEVTLFYHVRSEGRSPAGSSCTSRWSDPRMVTTSLVPEPSYSWPALSAAADADLDATGITVRDQLLAMDQLFCTSTPTLIWFSEVPGDIALTDAYQFDVTLANDLLLGDVVQSYENLTPAELDRDIITLTSGESFVAWRSTLPTPLENNSNPGYTWQVSAKGERCNQNATSPTTLRAVFVADPLIDLVTPMDACETSPSFHFQQSAGAQQYLAEIETRPDDTQPWAPYDPNGTGDNTFTMPHQNGDAGVGQNVSNRYSGDLDNADYRYRVQAVFGLDQCPSNFTAWREFSILSSVSPMDNFTPGMNPTWTCSLGAPRADLLTWADPGGVVTDYLIEISGDPNANVSQSGAAWSPADTELNVNLDDFVAADMTANALIVSKRVPNTVTTLDLSTLPTLAERRMWWRVRALQNNCLGAWSSPFEINYDRIPAPVPTAPNHTDASDPTVTPVLVCNTVPTLQWQAIDWTPSAQQGQYEIEIALNDAFTGALPYTTNGTTFQPPSLTPGVWYWRVRPIHPDTECQNDVALEAWSPTWQIDIENEVAPPTLNDPANGTVFCDPTARLTWDPSLYATEYDIEVSTDPGFGGNPTVLNVAVPTTEATFTFPTTTNATYYWRVTAKNNRCEAPTESAIRNFDFAFIPQPSPVSPSLTLTPGSNTLTVSWNNPSQDPNHDTLILVRNETAMPADEADGTVLLNTTTDLSYIDPTVLFVDGEDYFYRTFSCNSCNQCVPLTAGETWIHDTVAPTLGPGGFTIDKGTPPQAQTVASTWTITLDNPTDGVGSGIDRYLIRETAIPPTAADFAADGVALAPTTYTLANIQTIGPVTLYAWMIDVAGNIGGPWQDDWVKTDAQNSPIGTILIVPTVGSGNFSGDELVDLTITADITFDMWISQTTTIPNTDPVDPATNTGWIPVNGNTAYAGWELCTAPCDGLREVYVKFRRAGPVVSSFHMSDDVILDTAAPTLTQFRANGTAAAQTVNSRDVSIEFAGLDGTGTNVVDMRSRLIQPTVQAWAAWNPVDVGPFNYPLPAANGAYQIEYEFRDEATNVGSSQSGVITLSTGKPTGTVTIEVRAADNANNIANDVYTTLANVDVDIAPDNAIADYRIANNASFTGPVATNPGWTTYTGAPLEVTNWALDQPLVDGTKTIYVQLRDSAGNISDTLTDTIIMDRTAPTASTFDIVANHDDGSTEYTNNRFLSIISIAGTDATSGVDEMAFATSLTGPWTQQGFSASASYALPATDGAYTVYMRLVDAAGNESTPPLSAPITLDTVAPTVLSHPWSADCIGTTLTGNLIFSEGVLNVVPAAISTVSLTPPPSSPVPTTGMTNASQYAISYAGLAANTQFITILASTMTDFAGNALGTSFYNWSTAASGVIYVDGAAGSDADSGLGSTCPKQTIAAAMTAANAGDEIRVCQGSYEELVSVNKSVTLLGGYDCATWTRDANFAYVGPQNWPPSAAEIDAGIPFDGLVGLTQIRGNLGFGGVTTVSVSAANVRIEGFNIESSANANSGSNLVRALVSTVGATNLELSHVQIDGGLNNVRAQFVILDADATIDNSVIRGQSDNSSVCTTIQTDADLTISNSLVQGGNCDTNIAINPGAAADITIESSDLVGGSGGLANRTILFNSTGSLTVRDSRIDAGQQLAGNPNFRALLIRSGSDFLLERNRIHGGTGPGISGAAIYIDQPTNYSGIFRNNLIHGGNNLNTAVAILIDGGPTGADKLQIVNNTILSGESNGSMGFSTADSSVGIYPFGSSTDDDRVELINNAIIVDDDGTGSNFGFYSIGVSSLEHDYLRLQNNAVLPNADTYLTIDTSHIRGTFGDPGFNNSSTQTGSNLDLLNETCHRLSFRGTNQTVINGTDDNFWTSTYAWASTTDTRLTQGGRNTSAAADGGVTVDIDGNPRSAPYSIGAFEVNGGVSVDDPEDSDTIYVDGTVANADNDGRLAICPAQTISSAYDRLQTSEDAGQDIAEIRVRGGSLGVPQTYEEVLTIDRGGFDLTGQWDASFTSQSVSNETLIQNATTATENHVIEFSDTISDPITFSQFDVHEQKATLTADQFAIEAYSQGDNLTISNVNITMVTRTGFGQVGIRLENSSTLVTDSHIVVPGFAIWEDQYATAHFYEPVFRRNYLECTIAQCTAVSLTSSFQIDNSVILANRIGILSGAWDNNTYTSNLAQAKLYNNTISAGATDSRGIELGYGVAVDITNNLILPSRLGSFTFGCILEGAGLGTWTEPSKLLHNVCLREGAPNETYRDALTSTTSQSIYSNHEFNDAQYSTEGSLSSAGGNLFIQASSNNLYTQIFGVAILDELADFALQASAPSWLTHTATSVIGSSPTDVEGTLRVAPHTIGAFEALNKTTFQASSAGWQATVNLGAANASDEMKVQIDGSGRVHIAFRPTSNTSVSGSTVNSDQIGIMRYDRNGSNPTLFTTPIADSYDRFDAFAIDGNGDYLLGVYRGGRGHQLLRYDGNWTQEGAATGHGSQNNSVWPVDVNRAFADIIPVSATVTIVASTWLNAGDREVYVTRLDNTSAPSTITHEEYAISDVGLPVPNDDGLQRIDALVLDGPDLIVLGASNGNLFSNFDGSYIPGAGAPNYACTIGGNQNDFKGFFVRLDSDDLSHQDSNWYDGSTNYASEEMEIFGAGSFPSNNQYVLAGVVPDEMSFGCTGNNINDGVRPLPTHTTNGGDEINFVMMTDRDGACLDLHLFPERMFGNATAGKIPFYDLDASFGRVSLAYSLNGSGPQLTPSLGHLGGQMIPIGGSDIGVLRFDRSGFDLDFVGARVIGSTADSTVLSVDAVNQGTVVVGLTHGEIGLGPFLQGATPNGPEYPYVLDLRTP